MDIARAEEMVKSLSAQKVADSLGVTKDSLQYHFKMAGTDVLQIKRDYAINEIERLLKDGLTCSEIAIETGFCLRKVKKYRKIVKSKELPQ